MIPTSNVSVRDAGVRARAPQLLVWRAVVLLGQVARRHALPAAHAALLLDDLVHDDGAAARDSPLRALLSCQHAFEYRRPERRPARGTLFEMYVAYFIGQFAFFPNIIFSGIFVPFSSIPCATRFHPINIIEYFRLISL